MRRYNRRDPLDRFFNIFPHIFAGMFAVALVMIVIWYTVIGYVVYNVISDPKGSAHFIGEIVSETVKPVIQDIEENQ